MGRKFPVNKTKLCKTNKSAKRWMRCRTPKPKLNSEPSEGEMPPWAVRSLRHVLDLLATLSSPKQRDS